MMVSVGIHIMGQILGQYELDTIIEHMKMWSFVLEGMLLLACLLPFT